MKKLMIVLFVVALSTSAGLHAQDTLRFLPHTILADVDTVVEWSTHADSVVMQNTGHTIVTGNIKFVTGVKDSATTTYFHHQDSVSYTAISINPLASHSFGLSHTYLTAFTTPTGNYKIGNNVIVIWPIITGSPGTYCKDSLFDTVYVNRAMGMHELDVYNLFRMYPNPARESVLIDGDHAPGKDIEEVAIYNLEGKLVADFRKQRWINVSAISRGAYLVRVRFADGSIGRRKLLLE